MIKNSLGWYKGQFCHQGEINLGTYYPKCTAHLLIARLLIWWTEQKYLVLVAMMKPMSWAIKLPARSWIFHSWNFIMDWSCLRLRRVWICLQGWISYHSLMNRFKYVTLSILIQLISLCKRISRCIHVALECIDDKKSLYINS